MQIETSNNTLTIQLRYCFDDENKHSMNAEVFNECERQFIKALKSTEKYFEDTLQIKIKPREAGSLIDTIQIITSNPAFNIILGSLITFIFTRFAPVIPQSQKTANTIDNLSKIREEIKKGNLTEEEANAIIESDKDLKKLKSNIFKNVKKEKDITKIETTTSTNTNEEPIIIIVERKDFDSFILPETTEQTDETQEAKIYIVAPILIKGRRDAWKGILEENSIDFRIVDKEFLEQVYNKQINFQNGTFINCELKTTTTTNIETEEVKITREVINVANYGEDEQPIKQVSHRRKPKKPDNSHQLTMFTDDQNPTE